MANKKWRGLNAKINFCLRNWPMGRWLLIALLIWAGALAIAYFVFPKGVYSFMVSPGTFFIGAMGIFTLWGLAIAIGRLKESDRISSFFTFKDFMREFIELIKEANSENNPLNILCYTPAIGNLSHPEEYQRLLRTFEGIDNLNFLNVICLGANKLNEFYIAYERIYEKDYGQNGRKIKSITLAENAKIEAIDLLILLHGKGANIDRKDKDTLPMFHLFFTKEKGIVYFAFTDYPLFFNKDHKILLEVGRDEKVEIMGFITKNNNLLARFAESYNFYSKKMA